MKIVVTGSLGNVGKPLVAQLVQMGYEVIVVSRSDKNKEEIANMGATAAIGSVKDIAFMKTVFRGADAAYCMIPPDYSDPDQIGHYSSVARSYAEAIPGSGIKKIVHLSSWGADLDKGTGFILGSYHAENILNTIPDISITHLRAGFLYYNLFGFVDMIKQTGNIVSNYGGDDKIVMTAPADIATAAAEELTHIDKDETRIKVRYIASDDRTGNEAAKILGAAIGKPDLQWIAISDEEMEKSMIQKGVPQHTIDNAIALNRSIHNGNMRGNYDKVGAYPTGKIKLKDFAKEFAAVYNKS